MSPPWPEEQVKEMRCLFRSLPKIRENRDGKWKETNTFAPVRTIFPDTKMRSTIFGCFMRYIRPGNSSGSYCTLREHKEVKFQPHFDFTKKKAFLLKLPKSIYATIIIIIIIMPIPINWGRLHNLTFQSEHIKCKLIGKLSSLGYLLLSKFS